MKKEWCYSWIDDTSDVRDDDDQLHGTNCAYLLHKAAPEADIYVGKLFRQNSFKHDEAQNVSKVWRSTRRQRARNWRARLPNTA